MSQLPFTQAPAEPQLKDVLDALKKDLLLELNCHHVGTVQSFDASNQTATVTINYKKTYFRLNAVTGLYAPLLVDYPLIIDCPVLVLGGGKARLSFPIRAGDECLLLFNDRDFDNWFQGTVGAPNATTRLHSFADAVALVGIRSLPNKLDNYDIVRAALTNDKASVAVGPEKIKLSNDAQNLGDLLQNLCDDIKALTDAFINNATGVVLVTPAPGNPGPLNPAIVTALNAVKSSVTTLATNLGGLIE